MFNEYIAPFSDAPFKSPAYPGAVVPDASLGTTLGLLSALRNGRLDYGYFSVTSMATIDLYCKENSLLIYTTRSTFPDNLADMFSRYGFFENKVLAAYFRKHFTGHVFINNSKKSTIAVTNIRQNAQFHFFQSALYQMLPWYFGNEELDQKEKDLLKTLAGTSAADYINAVSDIVRSCNFKEAGIRNMFAGFETARFDKAIEQMQGRIDENVMEYNELLQRLSEIAADNERLEVQVAGLRAAKENKSGGHMPEYFLTHDNFDLLRLDGSGRAVFRITAVLANFDRSYCRRACESKGSYLFANVSGETRLEAMTLFNEILVTERLKLKMYAVYSISPEAAVYGISQTSDYPADLPPNPHLRYYGCIGGYGDVFAELGKDFDFISLLDETAMSAGSVNFRESQNAARLVHDTMFCAGRCIILPDGKEVTVSEALEWIKENENE